MKLFYKKETFMICALFTLTNISAQENGQYCTALLQHGISNIIINTSEYDYLSVVNDKYCESSYSSLSKNKEASFGAAIESVPISLKGNSKKASMQHKEFCKNYREIGKASGGLRYESYRLYDNAIEAWRDCVKLALGGTQIKPSISPNQKIVDFTLSQTSGESTFNGVDVSNMNCKMNDKEIKGKESIKLNSNSISVRCTRTSRDVLFNGSQVEYSPEANVKIKTSTGDYRIYLSEAINAPIKDRISRIESQIVTLNENIKKNNNMFNRLGQATPTHNGTVNGPRIGGADVYKCPRGSFISSIHASGSVGGRYAVDGISEIKVQCTNLFKPKD